MAGFDGENAVLMIGSQTVGSQLVHGNLNGRPFSGHLYVDGQGYLRVRLPALLPEPVKPERKAVGS